MPNTNRFLRALALAVFVAALGCWPGSPAYARPLRGCDLPNRPRGVRCPAVAAKPVVRDNHPAIEPGGTVPVVDSTIPLLKPGMYRLDLSAFAQRFDLTGSRYGPGGSTSIQEAFTLGYGVNDRLTVFGGALQANTIPQDSTFRANFVDPRAGFTYRIARAPQLYGVALDFVGDAAVNQPLRPIPVSLGPRGDLGAFVRSRLLATKEIARGFTLQLSGGLFGAAVTMPALASIQGQRMFDVAALAGLAGQYRLSMISDRLYVNGELDAMKPLTRNEGQVIFASPFKTTESYSATIGTSYVIKPGAIIGRLTNTVALNVASDDTPLPPHCSKYALSDTVGVTISFVNFTPNSWMPALSR